MSEVRLTGRLRRIALGAPVCGVADVEDAASKEYADLAVEIATSAIAAQVAADAALAEAKAAEVAARAAEAAAAVAAAAAAAAEAAANKAETERLAAEAAAAEAAAQVARLAAIQAAITAEAARVAALAALQELEESIGGAISAIPDATASVRGMATAAQIAKLDALVLEPVVTSRVAFAPGTRQVVIYTVPSSPTGLGRFVLTRCIARLAMAFEGSGNMVISTGTTAGGTQILLPFTVTSASAVTVLSGELFTSLGASMLPAQGYEAIVPAGQDIYCNLTKNGTVTGGQIDLYLFGIPLAA
jgi:multidrug efflux pump subunit AcrA (membrane-fusion protein)